MKRTNVFAIALSALGIAAVTPVSAGFYMEGLQPFAGDYCADADPALTDPVVMRPMIDWETTSPDASTLGGRPAYTAENCATGKGTAASRPVRVHKALKHPKSVPQK
jgi:hypothetical protein